MWGKHAKLASGQPGNIFLRGVGTELRIMIPYNANGQKGWLRVYKDRAVLDGGTTNGDCWDVTEIGQFVPDISSLQFKEEQHNGALHLDASGDWFLYIKDGTFVHLPTGDLRGFDLNLPINFPRWRFVIPARQGLDATELLRFALPTAPST